MARRAVSNQIDQILGELRRHGVVSYSGWHTGPPRPNGKIRLSFDCLIPVEAVRSDDPSQASRSAKKIVEALVTRADQG